MDIRTIGSAGYLIDDSAVGALSSVAAGDVDGDGRDDVVTGHAAASPLGRSVAGAAYMVEGQDSSFTTNLDGPGAHIGFEIHGAGTQDQAGRSVAVADTNGDGSKDIIVGATGESAVYVVFGKTNTTDVDLSALGTAGYKISQASGGSQTGTSVASAGDVNLDGREDILIGDSTAMNGTTGSGIGAAYVVFGKANTTPVDLDTLGANGGYHIEGADAFDRAGTSVANAGDVNNDDRPDQIIGAPSAGFGLEGAAYVVFGKTTSSTVDLGALGSGGFEISGAYPDDNTGVAVAGGRDFNADGRSDVIVGADLADFNGRTSSGSAYVVYGKSSRKTVSLGGLDSSRGYRIDGPARDAVAGRAVASALSVTSNSGSDVIVGAPGNEANGRNNSGSVFVIDEGLQAAKSDVGLLNVSLSSRSLVFAAGRERALAAAPRPATLRYRLRRRASVTLRLHRILTGRRSGSPTGRQRCRKSTRSLQRARRRRCRRLVLMGRKVVRHRTRGRKSVRVPTRLRGRRLKPGLYLLSVTARERNGREWGPAIARIRVKRR